MTLAGLCVVVALAVPRAPSGARVALHLPRLDGLSAVTPFAEAAGAKAVLLRPQTWRGELNPLFFVDATSSDSLLAAGIEPSGSATLAYLAQGRVGCFGLRDAGLFEKRARERLRTIGAEWKPKAAAAGATVAGATVNGRVVMGFALRGKEACAASGDGADIEPLLRDLPRVLSRAAVGPGWKAAAASGGPLWIVTDRAALSLRGTAEALVATGRLLPAAQIPSLGSPAKSPYGAIRPSGLLFARLSVAPADLAAMTGTYAQVLALACPGCDRAQLAAVLAKLEPHLTGQVLVRVDAMKVTDSLRSFPARFFAVRHALALEVGSPEAAKAALVPLLEWPNVKPGKGDGEYLLALPGGELRVGWTDRQLVVGNHPQAHSALVEALSVSPAPAKHAAELFLDPVRLGKGLGQISLLDVVGAQDLAALFAAATELGPLLADSPGASVFLDPLPDGTKQLTARWSLRAPARDAGTSP